MRLIVGRFRQGYTELHLRAIIGYCASVLQWAIKDGRDGIPMRQWLRPETLFGPEAIERYVDQAWTWYESLPDAKRAPDAETLRDAQILRVLRGGA